MMLERSPRMECERTFQIGTYESPSTSAMPKECEVTQESKHYNTRCSVNFEFQMNGEQFLL